MGCVGEAVRCGDLWQAAVAGSQRPCAHRVAAARAAHRHTGRIRYTERKVRMTRLARLLVSLSLSALGVGAVAVACSHRGEAPATPRPELTSPSGAPSGAPMPGGWPASEASGITDA